ncbi:MAG TPA: apolipoprotein N-acyltransferase [Candidatus Margulisbacteria bacterium]|nr:MAG: apolipoprotein N-acyltransferase [Candidatus Margulisbacteria bacterium GWD2_39_127]OGI01649.1 MAG: apolipoprotein N-acyltransferase [Candidatus Margulisbacteria bacterium GWF2_38_17]OGI06907.1 MAG: apolipoprotein N-acyltransferase [Candidatus Margulisbacteria bacterium GWE2_39_32]HAR63613.1 apolipoprotein N-acyltransferase [Candidatus Margulisiibacteriota bacterium]HCT85226.1 apolipoprotein N-acyltransferase [Candidatus Margulisiibacteriota bacterium]
MDNIIKKNYINFICLVFGIFIIYCSFPNKNIYIPYLAWFCLVPLLWILKNQVNFKWKLLYSWLFFQPFFLLLFSFKESPIPPNYNIKPAFDGVLLFTLLFPIIYSLFFSCIAHFSKKSSFKNILLQTSLWVLFEHFFIAKIIGFPLSLALTNFNIANVIQVASYGGIDSVSAMIFAVNCGIVQIIDINIYRLTKSRSNNRLFHFLTPFLITCTLVAILILWGIIRINTSVSTGKEVRFSLIQPNASQYELYLVATSKPYFRRLLSNLIELSTKAKREFTPDVIIFPEGVLKEKIFTKDFYYEFQKFLNKLKTPLIIQSGVMDSALEKEYSATIYFNKNGVLKKTNYKQKLVPIFESNLYNIGHIQNVFFDVMDNVDIGTMICFEILFSKISRGLYKNNANVLIALSNNGYFGSSNWAFLHAAYTPFRAVEYGRPFILVNNTGFSVVTTSYGKITHLSPLGQRCISNVFITTSEQKTFYGEYPLIFIGICIGIVIISMIDLILSRKKYEYN